jgi:adenosylhomocysteine nucleosidase
VIETGIGRDRTDTITKWLLGYPMFESVPYRPKVVLSAGFAGALHEDYRVGDVILATEVVDPLGNRWPTTWPGDLPAGEWQPRLHRGRLLTVPGLVGKPADKQALGKRHEAVAADMESAAVARQCAAQGIPFGCVRAISDDVATRLSDQLVGLLAGPHIAAGGLLRTLVTSPSVAPELIRLAGNTRHAARQLAKALGELLTLTLPWGDQL